MTKQYSIAEARHNLAAIVHELEHQEAIELTRRGEPVAVLLSFNAYQRLLERQLSFWNAYMAFHESADLSQAQIETDTFDGVRDRSSGRDVLI